MSTSFPFTKAVPIHPGPFGDDIEHGITRRLLAAFRVGRVVIGVVRHSTAGEDQPRADLTARFAESLDQLAVALDCEAGLLDDLSDAARAAHSLLRDSSPRTGEVRPDLQRLRYVQFAVRAVEISATLSGAD